MSDQAMLSVADFFAFGNAAAAHTTDLRIKLAKAGIFDRETETEIDTKEAD